MKVLGSGGPFWLLPRLTNFMGHILSWQANSFIASPEIPSILWNPKVHYRFHNSQSLVPVLSQMNPVHVFSLHLFKMHSPITLLSTLRFCKLPICFGLLQRHLYRQSHACPLQRYYLKHALPIPIPVQSLPSYSSLASLGAAAPSNWDSVLYRLATFQQVARRRECHWLNEAYVHPLQTRLSGPFQFGIDF
jgi:hypothetical protein